VQVRLLGGGIGCVLGGVGGGVDDFLQLRADRLVLLGIQNARSDQVVTEARDDVILGLALELARLPVDALVVIG